MASAAQPSAAASASPQFRKVSLAEASRLEEPPADAVNATLLHPLGKCTWPRGDGSAAGDAESSRPLQTREWLSTQAAWAARLLTELLRGEAAWGEENKLNPASLNSCTALAFTNVSRGGLGVTYASGYGFVIKKLAQDQYGNSKFGNPLFYHVSQGGLGFSAGYQHSQSVIAVLAAGSLDAFKDGTTSLGSDLGLFSTDGALTGLNTGLAVGGTQHMGMTVANERAAFCYSKVDGVYLDVSAHRTALTPDTPCNSELYGEGYVPDDVLNGSEAYRQEMLPLLRLINQIGKQAMQHS